VPGTRPPRTHFAQETSELVAAGLGLELPDSGFQRLDDLNVRAAVELAAVFFYRLRPVVLGVFLFDRHVQRADVLARVRRFHRVRIVLPAQTDRVETCGTDGMNSATDETRAALRAKSKKKNRKKKSIRKRNARGIGVSVGLRR